MSNGIIVREGVSIDPIFEGGGGGAAKAFSYCRRTGGGVQVNLTTGVWFDLPRATLVPFVNMESGLTHLGSGIIENTSGSEKTVSISAKSDLVRDVGTSLVVTPSLGFWDGVSYVPDPTYNLSNRALPLANSAASSYQGQDLEWSSVVLPAGGRVRLKLFIASRSSSLVDLIIYDFNQFIAEV